MSAQRLTQGTADFTISYSSRRVAKTKSHGSQSNKNEESFWLGQQLRYKLSYLTEEKNWYNFIFVPWRRFWHSSDLEVVVHLTEPTHPLRNVNHFVILDVSVHFVAAIFLYILLTGGDFSLSQLLELNLVSAEQRRRRRRRRCLSTRPSATNRQLKWNASNEPLWQQLSHI